MQLLYFSLFFLAVYCPHQHKHQKQKNRSASFSYFHFLLQLKSVQTAQADVRLSEHEMLALCALIRGGGSKDHPAAAFKNNSKLFEAVRVHASI